MGFGKNVIPRRAHKERAQPAGRVARHGLLEKKKDYKIRARHKNRKDARFKLLREKAAMRNKDEFYHAMERTRTARGVARMERGADAAKPAVARDAALVDTKLAVERGRTRRLAAGLHFIGHAADVQRTHIRFVDDDELPDEDDEVNEEEAVEEEAGDQEAGEEEEVDEGPWLDPRVLRKRDKAYKELRLRRERVAKLESVAQDIATERKLRAKGARYKVRDADVERATPAVYKWKQQRKK